MKSQQAKQQKYVAATTANVGGGRAHKVWAIIALVGLFACGLMIGIGINKKSTSVQEIGMSSAQCNDLAAELIDVARCSSDSCIARMRELNEVYTNNCAGRMFQVQEVKEAQTQPQAEDDTDKKTCEVIEDLLESRLFLGESDDVNIHNVNIDVYEGLIENGCPENTEKYKELMARENAIIDALKSTNSSENTKTCTEIEDLLIGQLPNYPWDSCDIRIKRAKIYANLSERGCPENSQHFADLAAKELEIARALRDDEFSKDETIEIVETYKRLEMKQVAKEVLDKVQKLTDPAIDFILQMEKIINE